MKLLYIHFTSVAPLKVLSKCLLWSFTDISFSSCGLKAFLLYTYQYFIHSGGAGKTEQQFLKVCEEGCGVCAEFVLQFNGACHPLPFLIFSVCINLIFIHRKLHRPESSGKKTLINYCYSMLLTTCQKTKQYVVPKWAFQYIMHCLAIKQYIALLLCGLHTKKTDSSTVALNVEN